MTNSEFINAIAPIIVKEAKARGYKFPSAVIAQACLESNYGRSILSAYYFNYFGLKCGSSWKGKSINMKTSEEYTTGTVTQIRDNFRVFDNMEAGVKGYFDFISTKRYNNLKEATSPIDYLNKIKTDGYATSSRYVTNVYNVLTSNSLTRYDGETVTDDISVQDKTIVNIAKDVIRGKYGNGQTRKAWIEQMGYNYNEVQKVVNELLKGGKV